MLGAVCVRSTGVRRLLAPPHRAGVRPRLVVGAGTHGRGCGDEPGPHHIPGPGWAAEQGP